MVKFQSRVRLMTWVRHVGWRWRARAAALLALLAALCVRVPLRSELRAELRAPPHKLAVKLADFNHLRALYPHIESWRLESQWSNYTSWRYTLSFSCGGGCTGRGSVRAHDEYARAPEHGRARAAHGGHSLNTCRALPLLPWPTFCDSVEVKWSVAVGAAGAGAHYAESARARRALGAAALGWLRGGGGGGGGALAAERRDHLRALHDAVVDEGRAH